MEISHSSSGTTTPVGDAVNTATAVASDAVATNGPASAAATDASSGAATSTPAHDECQGYVEPRIRQVFRGRAIGAPLQLEPKDTCEPAPQGSDAGSAHPTTDTTTPAAAALTASSWAATIPAALAMDQFASTTASVRRMPSPAAQTTIRRLQTPYMLASPTAGAATAPAATSTAAAPLESDDESSSWGRRWPRPPSGQAFRHWLDLPGQAPRGTLDRIGRLATLAIELSRQPHFPRHRTAS